MDKSVRESVDKLQAVLTFANIHCFNKSDLRKVLLNDLECLPSLWRSLFDSLSFLRRDKVDIDLYARLVVEVGQQALCTLLRDEVVLLGLYCSESDLKTPLGVLRALGFVFAEYVLERLLRAAVFGTEEIILSIPTELQNASVNIDVNNFSENDVNDWAVLIHRLQILYKQVDTLSNKVITKYGRLLQCKVEPEILYLMKYKSVSLHYISLLRKSNECLKDLVDWFNCESVFWDWLGRLCKTFKNDENEGVVSLDPPIVHQTDQRLERCRTKLFQLESSSQVLDRLWSNALKNSDVNVVEVVGQINANIFIQNNAIGANIIPYKSSDINPFKSINRKLSETIDQFNEKYQKKLKKLAKHINGLILDGSS